MSNGLPRDDEFSHKFVFNVWLWTDNTNNLRLLMYAARSVSRCCLSMCCVYTKYLIRNNPFISKICDPLSCQGFVFFVVCLFVSGFSFCLFVCLFVCFVLFCFILLFFCFFLLLSLLDFFSFQKLIPRFMTFDFLLTTIWNFWSGMI